jgi:hypothetical protein
MPSKHQQNNSENYDVWQRAFRGDIDLEPLIRGIHNERTALKAHRKAHEYDASTETKERIAEILREYND